MTNFIKCDSCLNWDGGGDKTCFRCPDWELVTYFSDDITYEDRILIKSELEERRIRERNQ